MENLQSNIKEWETKALDLSQRLAQFSIRVKGKVDRLKTLYDRLTNNLKEVDVSQVVDSADQVSIMEMAGPPVSVRQELLKEAFSSVSAVALLPVVLILLLLDRIDDRMKATLASSSISSPRTFLARFKGKNKDESILLQPDDARHVMARSYRNIRSSIFFMPYEGP